MPPVVVPAAPDAARGEAEAAGAVTTGVGLDPAEDGLAVAPADDPGPVDAVGAVVADGLGVPIGFGVELLLAFGVDLAVGAAVGFGVGATVGFGVGAGVGFGVGAGVGVGLGLPGRAEG